MTTYKNLQHLLSLRIHFNNVVFEGGDLRNVVITPLTLLLLELDRDTTDLAVSQPLHQMCNKSKEHGYDIKD